MVLTLPEPTLRQLVSHCYDGLPDEACGLLGGRAGSDRVEVFVPTANADRSSRTYSIDGRDLLRAERELEGRGMEVLGVAHSHTHTEAYPSPTDVEQAPDPTWHYVIVSLRQEAPVTRSYRIVDGTISEEVVAVSDR